MIGDGRARAGPLGWAGLAVTAAEDYVRYLREFRVVDAVEVRSAPVEIGAQHLVAYHEIRNPADGRVAATVRRRIVCDRAWPADYRARAEALDVPVMRPNVAVFGQRVWTRLRNHPRVVSAVFGSNQSGMLVTRQMMAEVLELQAVYVGAGFVNTAKAGQTPTLSRVWGNHAAFLYRDRAAGPQAGTTFGFTAERPAGRTSKCRWGPVDRPVEPTLAIGVPAFTTWPSLNTRWLNTHQG